VQPLTTASTVTAPSQRASTLPAAAPASPFGTPLSTVSGSGIGGAGARPLRVLVVEDDPSNSKLVMRMLAKEAALASAVFDGKDIPLMAGHQCGGGGAGAGRLWYETGVRSCGVGIARGLPFDVILLDIVMHVTNGVAVARALRAHGYGGVIVAMTANTSPDDVERYTAAGFSGVLGKPFNMRHLRAALAAAAERAASGGGGGGGGADDERDVTDGAVGGGGGGSSVRGGRDGGWETLRLGRGGEEAGGGRGGGGGGVDESDVGSVTYA
jgi:CheY-like chemotaxis protein